jgi:hypothetical protein
MLQAGKGPRKRFDHHLREWMSFRFQGSGDVSAWTSGCDASACDRVTRTPGAPAHALVFDVIRGLPEEVRGIRKREAMR